MPLIYKNLVYKPSQVPWLVLSPFSKLVMPCFFHSSVTPIINGTAASYRSTRCLFSTYSTGETVHQPDENPCCQAPILLEGLTMVHAVPYAATGVGGCSTGAGERGREIGYTARALLRRRAAPGGGRRAQACSLSTAVLSWRRSWLNTLNCGNQPI